MADNQGPAKNFALTGATSYNIGFTSVFTTVADTLIKPFPSDATAVATGFAALTVRYQLAGSATAVASASGPLNGTWQFASGATGVASGFATMNPDFSGSGTGVATAVGQLEVPLRFTSGAQAVANAFAPLGVSKRMSGSGTGTANARGTFDVFKTVVNPILAGELVDQSDQNVFQFRVGGSLVNLSSTNKYQLRDISVDYTGSSLSWTEIVTTDIGSPSFDLNDTVQMDVDWGDGIQRVFTGRVRTRNAQARNNDHSFVYEAQSTQRLADELTLVNSNGRPEFEWTVGTTIIGSDSVTGTDITTTFAYKLSDAVQDVFTVMTSALANETIPATIGVPGLEQFTINLPETVEIVNSNFVAGIEQLASLQPGVKVFFNEEQQAWTFPNLLNLPTAVVDISSTQITEANFDKDVNERYTAVRLIADSEDFLDNAIANDAFPLIRTEVSLTPKWNQSLDGSWTVAKALETQVNAGANPEYFYIYRKFSVPNDAIMPIFGFPITVKVKQRVFDTFRYRTVNGKLNWRRKEWMSRYWLFDGDNPHVEGDTLPPTEVNMYYYPIQGMSYVTTITSGTGVATIVTSAPLSDFASEIRIPTTGFEGTAYSEAGIERELVQIVSGTEVTTENAQALLDEAKNIIVSGTLPFEGDILESGIYLSQQLFLQHATRNTGIESVAGIITEYTHSFGRPGLTQITMSSQPSGVLGNG